jgi:hypothetical protein
MEDVLTGYQDCSQVTDCRARSIGSTKRNEILEWGKEAEMARITVEDLIRKLQDLRREYPQIATFMSEEAAKYALKRARYYSRGTMSYPEMAAADHPYAVRHGGSDIDDIIVNMHSKEFLQGWEIHQRGATWVLINTSPHAAFVLGGTDNMIARRLLQRVKADVRNWQRSEGQRLHQEKVNKALG